MASITRQPNGRRTVQFVAGDGKRKSIRLGKVSQRVAEAVKIRVEQLNAAAIAGHAIDDETARWVAGLDSKLADMLAAVGLIPKRGRATLGALLDRYFDVRADVKPDTLIVWGHTRRNLLQFFGTDKPLREITQGDAVEWRLFLDNQQNLAEPTIRKRCGFAKQFFNFAVKHKLIPVNPLADLKSASQSNPSRYYFITQEEAYKVLDACPDAQWRLTFALSRYGGLRCPSEHLKLRWGDVDWERGRITVTSPKTEHHPGGASRVIPLFPELRPYLEEAWEQAEPGTEYILTRRRNANANLRTQLLRIIRRAGLTPWPKLFQNLRSTRQTELEETFPSHVVCAWIGNSELIARKHYLQVTDDHYQLAVGDVAGADSKALQKAVQQPHETGSNGSQAGSDAHRKAPVLQGFAASCDGMQNHPVEDRGLEPLTFWLPARRSPN